jgi:hypothetical protein
MSPFVSAADPIVESMMRRFISAAKKGAVTPALQDEIRRFIYEDHAAGFRVFIELLRSQRIPEHAFPAIDNMWIARELGMRAGWECFRGGTKTTTLTEGFDLYRIALEPEKSNLLIQAADDQGKKHASNIAAQIEHNPNWTMLAPHVVPDSEKGWSSTGYWVKRTDMTYGHWTALRDKDPTMLGAGYGAAIATGSHPTGCLAIDDINNDKNTESLTMTEGVNRVLTDTLLYTLVPGSWPFFNQTPWTEHDALALVKNSGVWRFVKTPVFEFIEEDEIDPERPERDVWYERFDSWVRLAWPERWNIEELEKKHKETGAVGFARMMLLNLDLAKGHTLRAEWLGTFPHEDIDLSWPDFMGVDYASSPDRLRHKVRDNFACYWGKVSPQRRLIVVDGYTARISQQEAYQFVIAQVQRLPRLQQIGIEAIGKGEEFMELTRMAPIYMPIFPIPSHTGLARSKGGRFEKVLAPMFQRGDILLSSLLTPGLQQLHDEWVMWDGKERYTDDALDAVYMMAKAAEGFIAVPALQTTGDPGVSPIWRAEQQAQSNPFSGIRDHHG